MTPPFTIHRLFSLSRSRSRSLSLSFPLSFPRLPLASSSFLSLSSHLYSEYTTYTLPKLRTLSTLSSIFISVKYWLDFGRGWGKGDQVGDLGSTNGGRRMDERKKKKNIFWTIFGFSRRFLFFLFSFPSFFSSSSLIHDLSFPPCCWPPSCSFESRVLVINFSMISKIQWGTGAWVVGWLNGEDVQSGRR